ncbi:MAG TPA: DMT family transporter [Gammaproteobacteria bacterium]
MTPLAKARVQIHVCVVLWGFTAILGKLISLAALPLVLWRMTIVVAALALVPRVWRALSTLSVRLAAAYAGIGVLVALHWLTFYGAVKLANASVAATCMALATAFVAIVEPRVAGARFSLRDLALGILIVPGVALVVGGVQEGMRVGIAVGTLSALLVAVFGSLNKRLVAHADPLAVTALELGAGAVALGVLSPLLGRIFPQLASDPFVLPGARDAALLVTLALACTLLPFALSLVALRHISAFGAQLAVNLEPVYAILLAIPLLGEQRELTAVFYVGVAIILGAVFAHPLLERPGRVEHTEVLATAEAKHVAD